MSIKVTGILAVKAVNGANGRFCVGNINTPIGDFRVSDVALDQFEEGRYEGQFVIDRVLSSAVNDDEIDDAVIRQAKDILTRRMRQHGAGLTSPTLVKDYLRLSIAELGYEVFCVVFLDAQHRVIAVDEMFRGTLTQASVYPREVVKAALAHNACAVIIAHNHPSGVAEPSQADIRLTKMLKDALALVDVTVLDHFIIVAGAIVSFAERGSL